MTRPHAALTDEQVRAAFASHGPIDLDTNFFEAGFTSAMLAGVLTSLRSLAVDVSLVDLYRYPTVRKLTAALGARQAGPPGAGRTAPPWARRVATPGS